MNIEKIRTNEITSKVILYTHSKRKSDNRHPVKIRITAHRKANYFAVKYNNKNLFLSDAEFELVTNEKDFPKVRGANKEIRETIKKIDTMATEAIKKATANNAPFSWEAFESEFIFQESKKTFYEIFETYLNDLKSKDRIGTFSSYQCALVALKKFAPSLRPEQINVQFLKDFEAYLFRAKEDIIKTKNGTRTIKRKGCSPTTVGIYMRSIRAVLNFAIAKNPDLNRFYPFPRTPSEKGRYNIPEGSGHKGEAMKDADFKKFVSISLEPHSPEWRAKLYFLFSYFAVGLNFTDIAHLKYKSQGSDKLGVDIENEVLSFVRQKTKRTNRNQKVIEISLNKNALEIINLLNTDTENIRRMGVYVFPILQPGMSPTDQKKAVARWIKSVNASLRKICLQNDLPVITTYWSRHSAASHLLFNDVRIEIISQLLGHRDVKTTAVYTARFDHSKIKSVTDSLAVNIKM
ncbi:MAG TPA: site-specific integrase [Ohtaekwangia sp.]|nr:site-specific integrase [Ohtaekwangia sp.]